jgi:hypothetical protein
MCVILDIIGSGICEITFKRQYISNMYSQVFNLGYSRLHV